MKFDIDTPAPFTSGYRSWPLPVADTKARVFHGAQVMFETTDPVDFVYDYPLSVVVHRVHTLKSGKWTRRKVARTIQNDYARIYREEDKVDSVGNIPGMLNRATSQGPYGIWGHVIEDLVIEGVTYNPQTNTIRMSIGS